MRDLTCLNTIIPDNLAAHIDLSNIKSWDLNTGFTSLSLTKWSEGFSSDLLLYDFGLTGFDNGRVNEITDSLSITANENKLKLYRIGYNNQTGGTFYNQYGITGVTGASFGSYFQLDGGYLQGFFKLNGYDYQVLPNRYGSGVTIETLINIDQTSFNNGYFLFLGARAEDKYIPEFIGEAVLLDSVNKTFSGVTTSLNNNLVSTSTIEATKKAINDQNHTEEINQINLNDDINNNVIGFYISTDKKIGYTRIDENGNIINGESINNMITGWTIITIQFKPYEIINDKDLLDCAPIRKGDFNVFVNGRLFWKIKEFDEFYFRGFKNDKEKQLGVPYSISWGGGSFGLKHSYHWNVNERTIFDENTQNDITSGYTFVNNPTITYDCPPESLTGITQYLTITGNNTTFSNVDPCDPLIITPNQVLEISHDGSTGTTINEYYIEYSENIELISNRDYTFTVNFYDNGIFNLNSTGETGLFFYGNVDILVIEEIPYIKTQSLPNEWFKIRYKIRLLDNTNKQSIKVGFYVKSDAQLNDGFIFYFDKFIYSGSDSLIQDVTKDNQKIENTYSTSFNGAIQKLRIYDSSLSPQEILHNAMIESKTLGYNLSISKGGRLIYG